MREEDDDDAGWQDDIEEEEGKGDWDMEEDDPVAAPLPPPLPRPRPLLISSEARRATAVLSGPNKALADKLMSHNAATGFIPNQYLVFVADLVREGEGNAMEKLTIYLTEKRSDHTLKMLWEQAALCEAPWVVRSLSTATDFIGWPEFTIDIVIRGAIGTALSLLSGDMTMFDTIIDVRPMEWKKALAKIDWCVHNFVDASVPESSMLHFLKRVRDSDAPTSRLPAIINALCDALRPHPWGASMLQTLHFSFPEQYAAWELSVKVRHPDYRDDCIKGILAKHFNHIPGLSQLVVDYDPGWLTVALYQPEAVASLHPDLPHVPHSVWLL